MNMKKCLSLLTLLLLCWATLPAQLVNTGKMHVKGTMYVKGNLKMLNPTGNTDADVVSVVHNGTTAVTGNFYHDAVGNVFQKANNATGRPKGVTASTGTIKFVTNNTSGERTITTNKTVGTAATNYDRTRDYTAFPNIMIDTNDKIVVPATMGLDARTITLGTSKTGKLYLESNLIGTDKIYDASLRVTGNLVSGGSYDYTVAEGAVVIEKRVKEFREIANDDKLAATNLMPFAAPFTSMRTGYFAGNWVRSPQETDGTYLYPYANKDSDKDTYVDSDQYIVDPRATFTATKPYLIRLQVDGGTEGNHYVDLGETAGETHNIDKFVFNGTPFSNLGTVSDGTLFTGDLTADNNIKGASKNLLIGNSYTSALDGEAIATALGASSIKFNSNMYIYHHGATAYETYSMKTAADVEDIQSMSIFMISTSKNQGATATFKIGPEYQIHASGITPKLDVSTPLPLTKSLAKAAKETAEITNELALVLTPSSNPFIYDRTYITLNEKADLNSDNQDISKLSHGSSQMFQIYGTNNTGSVLQRNALPYTAEKALLSVNPAADEMEVTLTAGNAENFATDVLDLYDAKTKQTYDLKLNNEYTFTLSPGDNADRFELRFVRSTTDLDEISNSGWYAYTSGNELIVKSLTEPNLDSQAGIYSTAGVLHIQQAVNNVPEQRINISSLPAGVYMLTIQGKTVKFVK